MLRGLSRIIERHIKNGLETRMITELREWIMLTAELYICWILTMEYFYDAAKDAKKQRRTKTTKKTTSKAGESVVEESVEVSEPVPEEKNERNEPKVELP